MTKHIFTLSNGEEYELDEDSKQVLKQPKGKNLTYEQAKQLNINESKSQTITEINMTTAEFIQMLARERSIIVT